MKNKKLRLPEFLTPELKGLERRLDRACKWVEENREKIHPSISFIQAIELYDFGIDVTQIDPTTHRQI